MNLKDKIKFLIDSGFTFGQLGKICECHPSSISKWVGNKINISPKLEESIKIHIDSFLNKIIEYWRN